MVVHASAFEIRIVELNLAAAQLDLAPFRGLAQLLQVVWIQSPHSVVPMVPVPEDHRRRVRHAWLGTHGLESGPSKLIVRRNLTGVLQQDEQDFDDREHAIKI